MIAFIIKQGMIYCEFKSTSFYIDYDKETGLEVIANNLILGHKQKLDGNLKAEEMIPLIKGQLESVLISGAYKLGFSLTTALSILREINVVLPTVVYLVKRKAV